MDYEKKYKEALEKLQEALTPTEDGCKISGLTRGCIENIFPELAESENERIRNEIVRFIQMEVEDEIVGNKWIAWLKKQGNKPQGKSALEAAQEEKVDNQNCVKLADKIESTFEVGDWVVIKANGNEHVKQIVRIEYFASGHPQYIGFDGLWFGNGTEARLWTIQDAKDGDVLVSKSGNKIFSYRGSLDLKGRPCAYYGIYKVHDGIRFTPCAIGNYFTYEEVYPATKEQREQLEKAMADAGYTFDFEKKEVNKIEKKFNVGDEIKTANEGPLAITKIDEKGYWSEDLFICDFDDAAKWELVEQKPAWSEEDEKIRIEKLKKNNYDKET